ncbi:MAG: hypothetical protein LH461_01530 [Spirochaetaceae bacterium]|nr:hypothetical protein [Spirochaetaceae bacterium]
MTCALPSLSSLSRRRRRSGCRGARAGRPCAASVTSCPLPSGRDSHRTLEDYKDDLRELAAIKPGVVERFALPHTTLEGRTVYGVEISDDEVYYKEANGSLTKVASSGNFVGEKELATLDAPQAGTYVLRVINFASVSPAWTMTAGLYATEDRIVGDGLVENWPLTCERPDGTVLQTVPVVVDRAQQVKPDLSVCRERF